jgi:ArsR family transcriptional regulator
VALETVHRALADKTRLRILGLLAAGEVCVCHIYGALGIPQPTASRHLAYLRRAGLVSARRDGLWMHYRIAKPADPAANSVLEATLHGLGHMPSVGVDRRRLTKLVPVDFEPVSCCRPGCCG